MGTAAGIAIEELEAFDLSDQRAVVAAYPEADVLAAREYVPDSICGTAEMFGRIVGDGGLNKVAWAEAMGPRLTTSVGRTRSPSFRLLITGLQTLVAPAARPKKKTARKRRSPRTREMPSGRRK